LKNPYHIINLTLAGIILLIFVYSGLFSAQKDNHPIPSFYEEITGEPTASSGLSRSFSEIVRGNFESARKYNKFGIWVFCFFLIQFVQRISISLFLRFQKINIRKLVIMDSLFSIVLFLLCFQGLIRAYFGTIFVEL